MYVDFRVDVQPWAFGRGIEVVDISAQPLVEA